MTVEISEINIRFDIGAGPSNAPVQLARSDAPSPDRCGGIPLSEDQKQDLIEACVRRVLDVLHRSGER